MVLYSPYITYLNILRILWFPYCNNRIILIWLITANTSPHLQIPFNPTQNISSEQLVYRAHLTEFRQSRRL